MDIAYSRFNVYNSSAKFVTLLINQELCIASFSSFVSMKLLLFMKYEFSNFNYGKKSFRGQIMLLYILQLKGTKL